MHRYEAPHAIAAQREVDRGATRNHHGRELDRRKGAKVHRSTEERTLDRAKCVNKKNDRNSHGEAFEGRFAIEGGDQRGRRSYDKRDECSCDNADPKDGILVALFQLQSLNEGRTKSKVLEYRGESREHKNHTDKSKVFG